MEYSNIKPINDLKSIHQTFIWGARMTGIGAFRFLSSKNITVSGFIDSDPAFKDIKLKKLSIFDPTELSTNLKNHNEQINIVIAVSLKESEILKLIGKFFSIQNVNLFNFSNENTLFHTVDIVGSCNLKCPTCPQSFKTNVPKGLMSFQNYKNVLQKIIKNNEIVSHICFYSWGEPLLHNELDKFIKLTHKKNIAVAISTNLSIRFEDRIQKLIMAEPDIIKISLSGFYKEAYDKTHTGGDINLVKSNLYKLKYLIDRYKKDILVDINYHKYIDNSGKNLKKFKELAKELNFMLSETYALIMPLERVIEYKKNPKLKDTLEIEKNLLVGIDDGINASKDEKFNISNCPFKKNQININADMTVPVCCLTFNREKSIVSNDFLKDDYEKINENKEKSKICVECIKFDLPQYNMGLNKKKWDAIADKKIILD